MKHVRKPLVSWMAAMAMLADGAAAATIAVEESLASVGNGVFASSNNGLYPEAGSKFFGLDVGVVSDARSGVAHVRFSDLGLGPAIQSGTYQLVMRVASNGRQDWPGARDTTVLDSGSGYACGFFTLVGSSGGETLNHMADFNNTPGVTYTSDSSFLAAPDPLPMAFAEDTWHSVTSTWTIAQSSSVVGMDPFVGVGFEVGNGSGSAVFIDDSTLSFTTADGLYADWVAGYPGIGDGTNLTGNADGDALDNLAEYALGGDPSDGTDAGHAPTLSIGDGTNGVEFVHAQRRDAAARGLTYQLGFSTNLAAGVWADGSGPASGTGVLDAEFYAVTNRLPDSAAPAQFARIQVGFDPAAADDYTPKTKKSLAKILGDYPQLSSLMGAEWYYNWGRAPGASAPPNIEYVPMVWGAPKTPEGLIDADALRGKIREALANTPGCKNLLAFNEPDHVNQSNLTVAQALEAWPVFEQELAGTEIRLGSPGVVSIVNSEWLAEFMAEASNRNYRVDFVCVHRRISYKNINNPVNVLADECKALYARHGKPIWITELELTGTGITEADVIRIWQEWGERLENDPSMEGIVERYALAYAPPDTDIDYKIPARPFGTDGKLTDFGRAFQRMHEPKEDDR